MKKRGFAFVFLTLLLLTSRISVSACDRVVPRYPIRIESEDGSKVFYFDSTGHSRTGVFYNTQPLEVIYLLEDMGRHTGSNQFFFSNDFQYLAIVRPSGPGRVLSFYRNGALIRHYTMGELMLDASRAFRVCNSTIWIGEGQFPAAFNHRRNRLTIKTGDNLTHRFDIRTGRIIRDNEAIPIFKISVLISFAAVWFIKETLKSC